MNKIAEKIWWIVAVMLMPIGGANIIIDYVSNNWDALSWANTIIFVLMAIVIGNKFYEMENK